MRTLALTGLASLQFRARPIAQRAAFEAQIPTEVLRQDQSRSSVHHEGCAGKAALPVPRRAVYRPKTKAGRARIAEAQRRRFRSRNVRLSQSGALEASGVTSCAVSAWRHIPSAA